MKTATSNNAHVIASLERQLAEVERARIFAERLSDERASALNRLTRDLHAREAVLIERLKLKNELLLRAQRIARIATFHETADGELLFSREFGQVVGLPRDQLPSRVALLRLVHPLDRARVVRAHAHLFTEVSPGVDFTVSHRVLDAEKRLRWLRWTFQRAIHPEAGSSVSGTVQEITEQRASERRAAALNLIGLRQMRRLSQLAAEAEDARQSREQAFQSLEAVINTVPQGIAVFDSDLRLALWNTQVPELTDIAADDLVRGMPFDRFAALHWQHDPTACGDRLTRDPGGRVVEQRFDRTLSDGRFIEVQVRLLAGGGMVKTYADVSPLKAVEHDLRLKRDELASRVDELETISGQLRASQLEAENANRSKSQFLAMMSHDIRTPLYGVVGMLAVLAESGLQEQQRRQVGLARAAGEQLRLLLDDILEIVRAEAGKLELTPAPVATHATIDGIVAFWRATLATDDLLIDHVVDPALPGRISIDPTRLRQLFDNFISNAFKYTKVGRVYVRATRRDAFLRVEVEDSGPGIAHDQQAALFTDFSRLRTMSPGHTPGAGLGLAICQRIVTAMGGRIGVDSELGAGSCFWFEVPIVPVLDEGAEVNADAAGILQTSDGRRPRVLIAEDVETNRVVLQAMLDLIDCDHESVVDGQAAVDAVRGGGFDVVLMDVQMPRMDGAEATRAIRGLDGPERTIPIVGVTAHALRSERAALLDAGMTSCLSKPLQRPLLTRCLHDILAGETAMPIADAVVVDRSLDDLAAALPADRARAIVDLALRDLTTLRDKLATARRHGDGNAERRACHSLKGVASNIGAVALADLVTRDAPADLGEIDRLLAATKDVVYARLSVRRAA